MPNPKTPEDTTRLLLNDIRDHIRSLTSEGKTPPEYLFEQYLNLYKVHGPDGVAAGLIQEMADLKHRLHTIEQSSKLRGMTGGRRAV